MVWTAVTCPVRRPCGQRGASSPTQAGRANVTPGSNTDAGNGASICTSVYSSRSVTLPFTRKMMSRSCHQGPTAA